MEILQQKGLEFRDGEVVPLSGKPGPSGPAHREPRWKEGQFHRMGEEQRKEPRQPGCKHTKWKWEGSREGGAEHGEWRRGDVWLHTMARAHNRKV